MWVYCDDCAYEEWIDTKARVGSPEAMELSDLWWDHHERERHQ